MLHHHFPFSSPLCQSIERAGRLRRYAQGEVLSMEGDQLDSVLFLISGLVSLWIHTEDNRQLLMSVVSSGSILGGMPDIDQAGKTFTAISLESTLILRLPKSFARSLEKENLEYCQFLNRTLAKHFLKVVHVIKRERLLTRQQRLADIILEMLAVCKTTDLPVTQEQLASMADCSRPALIAELKLLEQEQAIKRKYGKIKVVDREKLERMAWINTNSTC